MFKDDWFGLSIQCLCITLNVWQAGVSCIASYLPKEPVVRDDFLQNIWLVINP